MNLVSLELLAVYCRILNFHPCFFLKKMVWNDKLIGKRFVDFQKLFEIFRGKRSNFLFYAQKSKIYCHIN